MKAEDVMKMLSWIDVASNNMGSATLSRDEVQGILALLREKDAEIERLREMNDALASRFGTVKADIAQTMIETARKQAFVAGDNQYISIAELEQIAKGEMT